MQPKKWRQKHDGRVRGNRICHTEEKAMLCAWGALRLTWDVPRPPFPVLQTSLQFLTIAMALLASSPRPVPSPVPMPPHIAVQVHPSSKAFLPLAPDSKSWFEFMIVWAPWVAFWQLRWNFLTNPPVKRENFHVGMRLIVVVVCILIINPSTTLVMTWSFTTVYKHEVCLI